LHGRRFGALNRIDQGATLVPSPAISHADLTRPRLLRLLDDIDRTASTTAGEIFALPPGVAPDLEAIPADDYRAAIADHAARSEVGSFLLLSPVEARIIAPPFPITAAIHLAGLHTEPLRGALTAEYRVVAVLLRLGGYAIGLYDGERLIEARNDARFVKNRHRKGGQSQRRFDRIREKQVHELFADTCEQARARLTPHAGRVDFLAFGGDRRAVQDCLKECRFLREFPAPVLPRFLTVPEPRHETLERLPALLYSGRLTTISREA
jgi:hypothetical protein